MYDVYLASPFFNDKEIQILEQSERILRERGLKVFSPREHTIENGENMSNEQWGKEVFMMDCNAITQCKCMVALYHGMYSDSGTAWEIGYAKALGSKILVVYVDKDEVSSLMVSNGSNAQIGSIEELESFDFEKFRGTVDSVEQK